MSSTTSATTKSTASSAILTSLNGSNGIDWNTLATNLSAAQFSNQTDRLTTRSDTLDKQISAAGNLKSSLLALAATFVGLGVLLLVGYNWEQMPPPRKVTAVAASPFRRKIGHLHYIPLSVR